MAIPDFQSITLPLLTLAADGAERRLRDAVEALAIEFHLTPEEQAHLLPSGAQRTFNNRVAWSASYLRAAGLLSSPGRGRYVITDRGKAVLAKPPERVDIKFLMQFPEFQVFRAGAVPPASEAQTAAPVSEETPEESFEASYQALRATVEQELLDRVKAGKSDFFEQLVVQLLVAMGYGGSQADAGQAVGQSGDGGIDGVIKEDRLGLDSLYLQAKRWEGVVGRPVVQSFAGSLEGVHARRGVLITTSDFSAEARQYVKGIEKRIVLIDGRDLAKLMFEFGVGVAAVGHPYLVKRVDLDFFE